MGRVHGYLAPQALATVPMVSNAPQDTLTRTVVNRLIDEIN
jgi:hypothetical protein